jgi:hypothetical protein
VGIHNRFANSKMPTKRSKRTMGERVDGMDIDRYEGGQISEEEREKEERKLNGM